MISENSQPSWSEILKAIVKRCLEDVPSCLASDKGRRITAVKLDGDPTVAAEIFAEDIASGMLKTIAPKVALFSEERDYLLQPKNATHLVLFDPVDCTYLAERGLPGASVGICVMEFPAKRMIAAVIGDYFTGDLYVADEKGAFRNDQLVKSSPITSLRNAYVSTCYGKASRVHKMIEGEGMVSGAFWIETTGGILAMAKVGTGQVDAYFDLMLGYKPFDFAPGAFFAERAGACVTDEFGKPLVWPDNPHQRCKFIIAASETLNLEIRQSVGGMKKVNAAQ